MRCGICDETVVAGQLQAHRATCNRAGRTSTLRVNLPWSKPPQSLNDRQHHHVKAKATAQALTEARMAVRATKLPKLAGANLTLHYRIADRRRRDATNLASVLKVVEDALVLEGVLPDDSWVCVPHSGQTIHEPDGTPAAMWLELQPLGEHP